MDLSKGVNALAGSPPSSSFLPSSASRNEAARCGDMPGVILASKELSSGKGGGNGGGSQDRSLSEFRNACLARSAPVAVRSWAPPAPFAPYILFANFRILRQSLPAVVRRGWRLWQWR